MRASTTPIAAARATETTPRTGCARRPRREPSRLLSTTIVPNRNGTVTVTRNSGAAIPITPTPIPIAIAVQVRPRIDDTAITAAAESRPRKG